MAGGPIYFVRMKLHPEHEAAFNAWYDREYLDTLKPISPLFRSIKRFVTGEGDNKEYFAVYETAPTRPTAATTGRSGSSAR
ncbi:MAG: hypothetical protein FJX78_07500 [Armatimonadetes bacterium]|nr:hypothetical protein [Armatimonadota bacterium]